MKYTSLVIGMMMVAGMHLMAADATGEKLDRHTLRPLGTPISFCAEPGKPQTYVWTAEKKHEGRSFAWNLTDFAGTQQLQTGQGTVVKGKLTVNLTLPDGYYEIRFPETEQLFGISVLPPHQGAVDSFFALEALLENHPAKVYEPCLALMAKHGIRHNREWTNFVQRCPRPGVYSDRTDGFYRAAGKQGIGSVFAFTDFPAWMDHIRTGNRYTLPGNLIGLEGALNRILDSRQAGLDGFHVLNEYDMANRPGESSLPPLKAAAWASRGRDLQLLGAAFCQGSSVISRDNIRNGMLDFIDVFCVHTYGTPEQLVEIIRGYRRDMAQQAKAQMPIWITECGKPWDRGVKEPLPSVYGGPLGKLHPLPGEDMTSALWIVMKAVEAKACGVARVFMFTLPFFQENYNNFGMLDYYRTPLRSMHAYAYASNLLSGKSYRGDWQGKVGMDWPVRVFSDGQEAVAVFYGGQAGIGLRSVDVSGLPQGVGRGADGALLTPVEGKLAFAGGMAYWVFSHADLKPGQLNEDTESMRMLKAAQAYKPVKRKHTPVVYRYDFRRSQGDWSQKVGYGFPSDGRLHFVVTNFSDQAVETCPKLEVPDGVKVLVAPPQRLVLPPRSETSLSVTVSPTTRVWLGDAGNRLSGSEVLLYVLKDLTSLDIDLSDLSRWVENGNGTQTFRFDELDQSLVVRTDFRVKKDPLNNNWAFPELHFTAAEKSKVVKAVSLDFRVDELGKNGRVQFPGIQLARHGQKYEFFALRAEPEWTHMMIPVPTNGTSPYDLFRVGMGTGGVELVFRFKNLKFWY